MKKKRIITIAMLVLFSILNCGFKAVSQDFVFSPQIRGWIKNGTICYLDTTVNINFDKIDVQEIESITFEVFDNGALVGNAVSKGENLENLLKYCSDFWGQTPASYTQVTGERTLTCKFRETDKGYDNSYWVRSKFKFDTEDMPSTVRVTLLANSQTYVTE